MFCPSCGEELPDGSQFCPACGAKVSAPPGGVPPAARPRTAPRSTQERVIRLALILVPVLVVGIALGVVVVEYDQSHSVAAVSDRFVTALQQRDVTTLSSLMTVNGTRPDATQLQAFCTWATDANHIQEIRQQLLVTGNPPTSGVDSSVPADRYLSFTERKLLVLRSCLIDAVPARAVFSGRSGTVVSLTGGGQQTMGSDTLEFPSLLPGKYPYTTQLPTALGTLSGSGTLTVEPLSGGAADVTNGFDNAALFKVPAGIAATTVALNGTNIPLQSGTSYQYVGPYPAAAYAVMVGTPAPWGTATYVGTTSSNTGVSTIVTTGISDATYAKLKEIAAVVDTYNTNDTLLARKKLGSTAVAFQGLEPGSSAYSYEEERVAKAASGSAQTYRYLQMILSSRFLSVNANEVHVLSAERYTGFSPVWDYAFVYRDGKFLLRSHTRLYGSYGDYVNSPRSIVITHDQ